ncbi:hypothetical protein IQ07DRAFT_284447 [Pyrenochaeta sp. DS3sAY3a]|nr:hypothetical protein IQ07DRAFT_284447 [Pyrenochaeta sp. DS3sAY3a]
MTSPLVSPTCKQFFRMRESPQSSELVAGDLEITQNYFQVQVPWLILPVLVWVCATAFLVITIFLTKRHCMPVWRSSTLILLDCKQPVAMLASDRRVEDRERKQPKYAELDETAGTWVLKEFDR